MMPRWANFPNLITGCRLILAPFIVRAILSQQHRLALAIFAVAAATDLIDGLLARHLRLSTKTGAFLDPIADKVLLSSVYVSLATIGSVPWWLVAIIFGRDLFLVAAAGFALLFTRLRRFPPSVWGKASTFLQILCAVCTMARNAAPHSGLDGLSRALVWPAAFGTIWSGTHYAWRGWHDLKISGGAFSTSSIDDRSGRE